MRAYLTYLSALVIVVFALFMAAHRFILTNYITIEDTQNLRIQNGVAKSLENYGSHVKKIIEDYAKWDESYLFLKGTNPNFAKSNFRRSSSTLEALSLCTMQFLTKKFTPILRLDADKNSYGEELGKQLLKTPQKTHGGFIEANGLIYYYYTHPITNTSSSMPSNGFLQGAFELNAKNILSYNVELKKLQFFSPKKWPKVGKEHTLKIDTIDLWVKTVKTKKNIENYFLIYSQENEPIWGIKTTHERTLYLEGERTVLLFLIVVIGMLLIFFGLILYRQKELQNEKNRLELAVSERTEDLKATMSELRQAVKKLETIAYVDELTGIKTRRAFFEIVSPLLEESIKKDKTLCIALIDLDDFKLINDTYGHAAGDTVLKDFCRVCEKFLDERMVFARFGGEEFVISFYGLSLKYVHEVCEKIQVYVGDHPVSISENAHVSYTFSLGVGCSSEAKSIDTILRLADKRLYKAKDGGKNLIRWR